MEINKYRWRQFIATYLGSFIVLLMISMVFETDWIDAYSLIIWPAVLGIVGVVGFNAGVKYNKEKQ
jgi:hypothetical protein